MIHWPNPISNPIHGNPCLDIFEDLIYTPIQFQIPILRNEITPRIWPNPISNPIHGNPSFDIFEHKQDLRCTPIQFQIPILRLSIISISRNEITHRIWPNPISNPIHGHPKMPLWMASLWAECWNWWILSNLELCGGFNQDRDKIAHTVYNQCRKKKHCQKHNGPEGWVLITKVTSLGHVTSSQTNLDQISSSYSRPSSNFKTSTKFQHFD